jgi:inner membrane protein
MDSLTQIALGAAVSVAVLRRRTAPWKSALWGAVAGTLPDLDVLIDHGDPVLNMVLHRAETHALFWLALFSVPFTALVVALQRQWRHWRAWWLAMALALLTHPLLDGFTVYGTQLLLPFSNHPYGLGSVFIIDPIVTLAWLGGTAWALATRGSAAGLRANLVGLALGTAYLGWGVVAQQQVERLAHQSLQAQGVQAERVLVTPAAFSSLLWRVVALADDQVLEGFHSLLDAPGPLHFDRFARGSALDAELGPIDRAQRIRDFSHGFYKVQAQDERVLITDLRMGLEPNYTFSFAVAERASPLHALPVPQAAGRRADLGQALPWFWRRLQGERLPPPR